MRRCAHCGSIAPADPESCPECCPQCGAWESLLEDLEPQAPVAIEDPALGVAATEISHVRVRKLSTGFACWDQAFSGGVLPRSSIVVYGRPGARKSTWWAAIAENLAKASAGIALYLSAEMRSEQLVSAVRRLRPPGPELLVVGKETGATSVERARAAILHRGPRVVVWDSLQAFDARGELAGSDGAIRLVLREGLELAATQNHIAILICQVNKEGQPAGPQRAIHDCDAVCELEPDRIRMHKNRGGTSPKEVAIEAV
jgi:DNA repair protein RadA/Sms